MSNSQSQVLQQRQEKAELLTSEGVPLYSNRYRPGATVADIRNRFKDQSKEDIEKIEETFAVAGRIMARRDYGKSVFFDIQDHSGRIQAYLQKNSVSPETFELFKKLDIGDIVGLSGRLFVTRTGELTIMVTSLELVTKSLSLWQRPLALGSR